MTGTAVTPVAGTVREVWRYPVKSMIGERVARAAITPIGLVGDRGWACRDEIRGGIRGAKKIGALMRLAAAYDEEPTVARRSPPVTITLPGGARVASSSPDVHARISAALDHAVTLWPLLPADELEHYRRGAGDTDDVIAELRDIFGRERDEPLPDLSVFPPEIVEFESLPGTYYDAFPLHLLTTTSLRSLAERLPGSRLDVRRFRPNLLVELEGSDDAVGDPFPEAAWVGRRLRIGEVRYEVAAPCPRCVMPTRDFADLPVDRAILRTIVRDAQQNLGVYLVPAADGEMSEGDAVELLA